MNQFSRTVSVVLLLISSLVQAQNDYFLPDLSSTEPGIPSPEEFLGYSIGDYHTRHDRLVAYFEKLAEVSDRATIQTIGYTYEHRPQVVLTVTSPENHGKLETIRTEHLKIADPSQPKPDVANMPVVIHLGYNVHGNEPSSSEASMLTAYYLVASNDDAVANYRENAVIHIEPVLNPDGRDRHTNWANMHQGNPRVADPIDREHNEVWPSGRVNHYWFDLNRDWLPLAHLESKNRVRFYHTWLPNLVTDYHEMGANATYFFEPTKPYGSENPVVPRSNYDNLNPLMAKYFASSLDNIGSLYWSKEVFDNSYPGYGSTYPDIHGGLGLVFEQASSRGHLQHTTTKDIHFAFTIRNHVTTSLATVKGTVENKTTFLNHQREFFESALTEAQKSSTKAWVFGDEYDNGRTQAFIDLLLRHRIKVYKNNGNLQAAGKEFKVGQSYIVPTNQPQYRMVRSVFEPVKTFYDSVFYDASAWSMSMSYGIPHGAVNTTRFSSGEEVIAAERNKIYVDKASYAYLVDWSEYYAPKLLYHLQKNGVFVNAAFQPFTAMIKGVAKQYPAGSLMISVADQEIDADELHEYVQEAATRSGVPVETVETGITLNGPDLGSRNFNTVQQPKALMIVGEGVYLYEAGEVWFLLDSKVNMPITKVDKVDLSRVDFSNYNTVVMVNGRYNDLSDKWVDRLKLWVQEGGTLITLKGATSWAIGKELAKIEIIKKEETEEKRMDYTDSRGFRGKEVVGGAIFEADVDITHPIGFGYMHRTLPVYRNSNLYLKPSESAFGTPVQYISNPWLSGYVSKANQEMAKNTASVVVSELGQGRVILFTDNPNFRGTWYGTNKLFLNALFFGNHIDVP